MRGVFTIRTCLAGLVSLILILTEPQAKAYSYMPTDSGKQLHLTPLNPWTSGPYVPLVGNVRNTSGIKPEELKRAVVRGLRMWQSASGQAFSFDYWQGEDTAIYEV